MISKPNLLMGKVLTILQKEGIYIVELFSKHKINLGQEENTSGI